MISIANSAAVLGRNCFGGASMLAHLARQRVLGPSTQLAMSGPAVIAAASGFDGSAVFQNVAGLGSAADEFAAPTHVHVLGAAAQSGN